MTETTETTAAAMATSTELTLHQRMVEIRKAVGNVPKNGYNAHFKFNFTKAEDVLNAVRKACNAFGVCVSTEVVNIIATPDNKNVITHLRVKFSYGFQEVVGEAVGQGQDSSDKAAMKSMTAALKYALAGPLLIAFGEDDPDEDHGEAAKAEKKAQKASQTPANKDIPASQVEAIKKQVDACIEDDEFRSVGLSILALKGLNGYDSIVEYFRKAQANKKESK